MSRGGIRSVPSSPLSALVIMLEAISDGLANRADLCSYILLRRRAFWIQEVICCKVSEDIWSHKAQIYARDR